MELVKLGKVVKLHGYMGQMKINTLYDKDFDIKKIQKVFDEAGNEYAVSRIFSSTDSVVVALENVDLQLAKTFVNKDFYIERSLLDGKILIEDLKNSTVRFESGETLGTITDVEDYGTAEVFYCLKTNGQELLFPNVKNIIISFDYIKKEMIISKDKLKEVSDYED